METLVERAARVAREHHVVTLQHDHAVVELSGARTVLLLEHRRPADHALIVVGHIGPEAIAAPRAMLELAAYLSAGAIALVAGCYVVRYAVPPERIESPALNEALEYVARVASELGVALASSKHTGEKLFSHYFE